MRLDEAEDLARGYMKLHNVDEGWDFAWSRSIINFGMTRNTWRRGVYVSEILLSKPLTEVMPSQAVEEIVLHEVAHAIVGPHHQHNALWREKCLEIGGSGDVREGDLQWSALVAPYIYVCQEGGEVVDISTRRLSTVGTLCKTHRAGLDRMRFDDSKNRIHDIDVVRHS